MEPGHEDREYGVPRIALSASIKCLNGARP